MKCLQLQAENLQEYKANPKWGALGPKTLTECAKSYCHVTRKSHIWQWDCGKNLTLMPIDYASAVHTRDYEWFAMEERNDKVQNLTKVTTIINTMVYETNP